MSVWVDHPHLVQHLIDVQKTGASCSQIALALGHGISRNSVVAKIFRLRLEGVEIPTINPSIMSRKKPVGGFTLPQRMGDTVSQPKIRTEPFIAKVDLTAPVPLIDEFGARITVINAKKSHCRYVHGDISTKDFHYCGNLVVRKSFCAYHAERCLVPPLPHKPRAS